MLRSTIRLGWGLQRYSINDRESRRKCTGQAHGQHGQLGFARSNCSAGNVMRAELPDVGRACLEHNVGLEQ